MVPVVSIYTNNIVYASILYYCRLYKAFYRVEQLVENDNI